MKIRRARSSDYKEMMRLYDLFVEKERYGNYDFDAYDKVLKSKKNFVWVVDAGGGHLIGFITFSKRWVVRYPKPIVEVDEMFVLEEYRGKGIGKKLIGIVEDYAKKNNCYRIYIESAYDRKVAHRFYENGGYTNYGYHFIKNI